MNIRNFPTLKMENAIRISLDKILKVLFKELQPGKVLEIGATYSPHKDLVPHTEYKTLDIARDSGADIISDVKDIQWQGDYFDTVICTEVLEHVNSPQTAINEIHRVLKPGGICILSTRFIQSYHPSPLDFYRFTMDSLRQLFCEFETIEIFPQGNRIQLIWTMIFGGKLAIIGNILNPLIGRINWQDNLWPCGYVVRAKKTLK